MKFLANVGPVQENFGAQDYGNDEGKTSGQTQAACALYQDEWINLVCPECLAPETPC